MCRGHKVAPGSCQATGHLAPREHHLPCTVWLRDFLGSRITVRRQPGLGDVPSSADCPCIGVWGSETFLALGITMHWYLQVQDGHGPSDCCTDVGGWEVSLSLGITTCGHLVLGHVPDSRNCPKWISGA